METTMMQNIADCCQCNIGDYDKIYDNAISIVVGIIASLVAWVIVNRALIPNVIVSELLYSNKNKPYVIVWNKSKLKIDLYEVVCYIYYYEKSKKYASFIRTDNKKALLSCGEKNGYILKIEIDGNYKGNSEELSNFFQTEGNLLKIIVTGQNRFGVRHVHTEYLKIKNVEFNNWGEN